MGLKKIFRSRSTAKAIKAVEEDANFETLAVRQSREIAARRRKWQLENAIARGDVRAREASLDSEVTVDEDLGERNYSVFSEAPTLADVNNRTVRGDEELLHGLGDPEWLAQKLGDGLLLDVRDVNCEPDEAKERMVASLPPEIWKQISAEMTPTDAANLAHSSKTLREKLGSEPWDVLNLPENKQYKIAFLLPMDRHLPTHLFCFPCASFHLRTQIGQERVKANYVSNPLFNCPNVRHSILPRMRVTHGYELPFAFAQLALRAKHHSPAHGMHYDLMARRWKCKDSEWSHQTRFYIDDRRLLFRSVSKCIAAHDLPISSQRLLLYSRKDYEPYFSVCAHWRDGELMNLCKCALSHIPRPRVSYTTQLKKRPMVSISEANPEFFTRMCNECLYMRRCPQCPTEYLIEVKVVEDRKDPRQTFKHAIVVTRWSDLGDGASPFSPEWAACVGKNKEYDSFKTHGRRAISGVFESKVSNCVPGQKILTLNPKMKSKGEEGTDWY